MRNTQLKLVYHERKLSVPICSSGDSYNFFMKVWDKQLLGLSEQVYVLYLNNNNEVIGWRCIGTGTQDSCLFNIKLAMACGLLCMASKMIMAHNHPAGKLMPSHSDLQVTDRIAEACGLVDIKLTDHIIICGNSYYSFVDNRLLKC